MTMIETHMEDGFLWARLPRIFNVEDCNRFEKELIPQLVTGIKLVVDLVDVAELYSCGLGFLIHLRKIVVEKVGTIALVNMGRGLREQFITLNLDRVFRMYATDVEFELDNEAVWKPRLLGGAKHFVCVAQLEDSLWQLIFTGVLDCDADVTVMRQPLPAGMNNAIFNFENLTFLDSFGLSELLTLQRRIADAGCPIAIFGLNPTVKGLLSLFPPPENVSFYETQLEAMAAVGVVSEQ